MKHKEHTCDRYGAGYDNGVEDERKRMIEKIGKQIEARLEEDFVLMSTKEYADGIIAGLECAVSIIKEKE